LEKPQGHGLELKEHGLYGLVLVSSRRDELVPFLLRRYKSFCEERRASVGAEISSITSKSTWNL
jgi:hypothetical protein